MTQTELDIIVMNAMCCMPNKAAELIQLMTIGDLLADQKMLEFITLMNLTNAIFGYDLTDTCLDSCDICNMTQQILTACTDCCTGMNGTPAPAWYDRDVPGDGPPQN